MAKPEHALEQMKCEDVQRRLNDLLLNKLAPSLSGRIRTHLFSCQECAWAWGQLIDTKVENSEISVPLPSKASMPSMDEVEKELRLINQRPIVLSLPLNQFYAAAMDSLTLRVAAEPERQHTAFIVNLGKNIPLTFLRRPLMNKDGEVSFKVELAIPESLEEQEIFVEVTYQPTNERLGSFRVRDKTETTIKTKLEQIDALSQTLAELKERPFEFLPLPPDAFSFRLWWEETSK